MSTSAQVAARQDVIDAARDLVGYIQGSGVANIDAAVAQVGYCIDRWRNAHPVSRPSPPTDLSPAPPHPPPHPAAVSGGPSPALSWPVPELRAWLAACPDDGIVTIRRASLTLGS